MLGVYTAFRSLGSYFCPPCWPLLYKVGALRSFKQGNAVAFRHLLLYKEGSVLPIKFHRSGFSRPHFAQSQDAVGGFSIVKTRLLVLYCLRFPLSLHKIDMSLPIR